MTAIVEITVVTRTNDHDSDGRQQCQRLTAKCLYKCLPLSMSLGIDTVPQNATTGTITHMITLYEPKITYKTIGGRQDARHENIF